jgi:hypothetical protein
LLGVVGYKDLAPTEPLFKNLLGLPLGYLKIAAWLLCYTIEGKAELYIEGQRVLLEPGDSWVIPIGAKHRYKILVPFTAIEVTSRLRKCTLEIRKAAFAIFCAFSRLFRFSLV